VGIPPALRERIFDPFFTTKPVGMGSGLGLSVCHAIVKAAGGDILVESEPGKGTTFRVVLPAAREVSAPLPQLFERSEGVARRRRVLVVDDEPLVGSAVQRILRPEFEVTVALEVGEALAHVREGPPFDAVLTDVMMPGETGEDLYRQIQTLQPDLADRVVFMTGGAFTERAQSFLHDIANPAIAKPLDAAELTDALERVMKRSPKPRSDTDRPASH
jgi:CheY-like chemotaxis protein